MDRPLEIALQTAKAAALGALVGTGPLTLASLIAGMIAVANGDGPGALIIVIPFGMGFLGALCGFALIGWPLTWWLSRKRRENRSAYLLAGAIGGGVLAGLVLALIIGGEFISLAAVAGFGAATGSATAHFWWRGARQARAARPTDEIAKVFG